MSKEENKTYNIEGNNLGVVQLADDVVAVIAGMAATEVEGVDSMAGNITRELISKLTNKSLSKGVKVEVKENIVKVYLSLILNYGYSVMDVSGKVQERVKSMIENMTGLVVEDVHIHVAGVAIDKEA